MALELKIKNEKPNDLVEFSLEVLDGRVIVVAEQDGKRAALMGFKRRGVLEGDEATEIIAFRCQLAEADTPSAITTNRIGGTGKALAFLDSPLECKINR